MSSSASEPLPQPPAPLAQTEKCTLVLDDQTYPPYILVAHDRSERSNQVWHRVHLFNMVESMTNGASGKVEVTSVIAARIQNRDWFVNPLQEIIGFLPPTLASVHYAVGQRRLLLQRGRK